MSKNFRARHVSSSDEEEAEVSTAENSQVDTTNFK